MNAFNIAASATHLAMPKYVKHLQLFNAEAETTYLQQSTYQSTRRGVRPRTENNDKRIFDYVGTYNGNNLITWMRGVGHLYPVPIICSYFCGILCDLNKDL